LKFKLTVNDPYIFLSKKDGQRVYDLPGALEDRSASDNQTGAMYTDRINNTQNLKTSTDPTLRPNS
jgi:hypothetical protein